MTRCYGQTPRGLRSPQVAGEREIVKEYSDTLLIFLLKGARPERYRDNLRLEAAFQLSVKEISARLHAGRERLARLKSAAEQTEALNIENEG
jgi:hypothetical protein